MAEQYGLLSGLIDPVPEGYERGGLLPFAKDPATGDVIFAAPSFVADSLGALDQGAAMAGGAAPVDPRAVTEFALTTGGGGGLLSAARGGVPRGALAANVFHGGPHRYAPEPGFPKGRPRLDKIGTGEGAQAYGHGWYSAEAPDVARGYQQTLRQVDTSAFDRGGLPPSQWNAAAMFARQTDASQPEAAARDFAQWVGRDYTPDLEGVFREAMGDGGTLYKFDIPDDVMPKLLDWDAPLSKQGEIGERAVAAYKKLKPYTVEQQAQDADILAELGVEIPKGPTSDPLLDMTGGQLLEELKSTLRFSGNGLSDGAADAAASDLLRDFGIPGVRYFDGMSRNAHHKIQLMHKGKPYGDPIDAHWSQLDDMVADYKAKGFDVDVSDGTRNYVIWDQSVLDRTVPLEINDVPTGLKPGDYPGLLD